MKSWQKTTAIILAAVILAMAIPFAAMADTATEVPLTNLALFKDVKASSTYIDPNGPYNYATIQAVDGNYGTGWISGLFAETQTDTNSLEFDLGTVYALDNVALYYNLFENGTNGRSNPKVINIYAKSAKADEWNKVGGVDDDAAGDTGWYGSRVLTLNAGTEGRYVKIEVQGMKDDTWSSDAHRFTEVEIWGRPCESTGTNLTVKEITGSSSLAADLTPANAVDGKVDTVWFAERTGDVQSWLELDLGADCSLESLMYYMWWLGNNSLSGPNHVTVEVKADGEENYTKILDHVSVEQFAWKAAGSIPLPEGTEGRYVKLTLDGGWTADEYAYHALAELYVVGAVLPPEPTEESTEATEESTEATEESTEAPTEESTEAPTETTRAPQLVDLAAGRKPTASSTMAGSNVANALDGDRESFWASEKFEVTGTDKSTLELDLGAKYPVESVTLKYPMFENGINGHSNPWIITIYGKSSANGEWTKIGGVNDKVGILTDPQGEPSWWVTARTIALDAGAEARYIKIELEGMKDNTDTADAHRICELIVMGYDVPVATGDTMSSLVMVVPVLALCGLAVTVISRKKNRA